MIGDTVNVASRLEALTRKVGAPLVVSGDAVAAVQRETNGDGEVLTGLEEREPAEIRGRAAKVPVWAMAEAATGA